MVLAVAFRHREIVQGPLDLGQIIGLVLGAADLGEPVALAVAGSVRRPAAGVLDVEAEAAAGRAAVEVAGRPHEALVLQGLSEVVARLPGGLKLFKGHGRPRRSLSCEEMMKRSASPFPAPQ